MGINIEGGRYARTTYGTVCPWKHHITPIKNYEYTCSLKRDTDMSNDQNARHHYIPRFILRPFCCDNKERIWYYDKLTGELSKRYIKDIFMERGLYRDEKNAPDDPEKVEKDLAKYEAEVAKLIRNRLLEDNTIHLTWEEKDSLELFLALLWFRSLRELEWEKERAGMSFFTRLIRKLRKIPDPYELWKQNVGHLSKCRSLEEVIMHPDISKYAKDKIISEVFGERGMYMIVAERRGPEDFIIGDSYPMGQSCKSKYHGHFSMYTFYPISPKRMVIMVYKTPEGIKFPISIKHFDDAFLKPPREDKKGITITVKKMYTEKVKELNDVFMDSAVSAIAFKDPGRVRIP